MKQFVIVALALFAALPIRRRSAEAKRLGGGRSLGTQRQATPPPAPHPARAAGAPGRFRPGHGAPKAAPRRDGRVALAGTAGRSRRRHRARRAAVAFRLVRRLREHPLLALLVFGRRLPDPRCSSAARRNPARADAICRRRGPPPTPGIVRSPQPGRRRFGRALRARLRRQRGRGAATATAGKFPPGFDPAPFAQQAKLQFRQPAGGLRHRRPHGAGRRHDARDVRRNRQGYRRARHAHAHGSRSRSTRRCSR